MRFPKINMDHLLKRKDILLGFTKMFTKVGAIADIHAPVFDPVFSYNLQFFRYFIENKAVKAFHFS